MDTDDLRRLLASDETDRVEKTVSFNDTDKFAEAVCAFANDFPNSRRPGYLFVGARPDGSSAGLAITDQLLQNLAALRTDGNILPSPSLVVQKVDLGSGPLAVVEVLPSDLPPVRYKGRVFIRVGPRRGVANEQDERVLAEKRQYLGKTWDLRPCLSSTLDDLSLDLFALAYRPRAVDRRVIDENHGPIERQLDALRLYEGRAAQAPTNAGILVLGLDPRAFFPGAYVQLVQYAGADKATEVLEEREVSGDLLTQLRGLDDFAASIARARPQADGLSERLQYDYPPVALHEIFANALIHRNYESTAPVMINVFSDRIEVLSPGNLYGMAPEDFPHVTGYRNPVVAEAAKIYGFVNRFGRGIDRARAELARHGAPPPEFTPGANHFLATIRRPR